MDISTLKSMFSRPSLADYLPGGAKSAADSGPASGILALLNGQNSGGDSGDSVNLSSMAQQILAAANGQTSSSTGASSGSSDDQKTAKATLNSFFTDNGVDLSKLSDQAQQLLQGFQDVIDNSGATTRDTKTDSLEEQYKGSNHKVFTLTGNNTRLRIAIDYADGKPQTLTITDIVGSNLETATVTLNKDADGAATGVQVARSQSSYLNGALASATTPTPLSMALYATS